MEHIRIIICLIISIILHAFDTATYTKEFNIGVLEKNYVDFFKTEGYSMLGQHRYNVQFIANQSFDNLIQFKKGAEELAKYSIVIGDFQYDIASITKELNIPYYVIQNFPAVPASNMFKAALNFHDFGVFADFFLHKTLNSRLTTALGDKSAKFFNIFQNVPNGALNIYLFDNTTASSVIAKKLAIPFKTNDKNSSVICVVEETNLDLAKRIIEQIVLQGQVFDRFFLFPFFVPESLLLPYRRTGGYFTTFNAEKKYYDTMQDYANDVFLDCLLHLSTALRNVTFMNATSIVVNVNNTKPWSKGLMMTILRNTAISGRASSMSFLPTGQRREISVRTLFTVNEPKWSTRLAEISLLKNESGVLSSHYRVGVNNPRKIPVKVAAYEHPVFLPISSTSGRFTGFGQHLMEQLLMKNGIEYKYVVPPRAEDRITGTMVNGSWTGLIRMLIDGDADITAFPIPASQSYRTYIHLSEKLFNSGFSMAIFRPEHRIDLFRIIMPFSLVVWIFAAASVILLCMVLWITNKISPNEGDSRDRLTLKNSCFLMFASIVMVKLIVKPRMISVRLLYILVWLGALLLVASYAANLYAMQMVALPPKLPFSSFQSLRSGGQAEGYYWAFLPGGDGVTRIEANKMENLHKNDFLEELYRIAESKWPKKMFLPGYKNISLALSHDHQLVYIDDNFAVSHLVFTHCDLRQIGSIEDPFDFSLAMRKDWVHADTVEKTLAEMKLNGILASMHSTYLDTGQCASATSSTTRPARPLEVFDMIGLFIVLGAGIVLAFLIVILEVLFRKIKFCIQRRAGGSSCQYGEVYPAVTSAVEPDGIWVKLRRGIGPYFLCNQDLHSHKNRKLTVSDLGIVVGSKVKVKYIGNDPESGRRRFLKVNK